MLWYKKLYIGEKAKHDKHRIIRNIKKHKPQIGVYVITLPENEKNILDIYPSVVLVQQYYQKKELFIVGIALSKEEAYEVMEKIVMDSYQLTGAFKIQELIDRY